MDGDRTTYRWRLGSRAEWGLLALLSVLLLPLAPFFLLGGWLHSRKSRELTIEPDAIEVPVRTFWGTRAVRISREEIGAIRVDFAGGGWVVWIDSGIERRALMSDDFANRSLTGPEMEWLAERLRAWKAEG